MSPVLYVTVSFTPRQSMFPSLNSIQAFFLYTTYELISMSHDTNTSTRKNKLVKDCSMKGEYRRTYSWPKQHFLLCVYVYEFVWNSSTFLCGSLLTGSTAEWDRGWQFPPSSLRDTFRHCVGWPAGDSSNLGPAWPSSAQWSRPVVSSAIVSCPLVLVGNQQQWPLL